MIVVATDDFELYHEAVGELRDRGATFTTVEPGDPLPEGTTVVVCGPDEDPFDGAGTGSDGAGTGSDGAGADGPGGAAAGGGSPGVEVVRADPAAPRAAVEAALSAARRAGTDDTGDGRTVVGVDPGERPGIAVLAGDRVVAAYQVPLAEAPNRVRDHVAGAPDPVVRVGDGARLRGARIIEALDGVRVELVDETGTTPHLGAGARGAGDLLAAVNIARVEGDPVEDRAVEPTAGEIQRIKDRSRERSGGRTIDEALARRVAAGELTVEEALAEHAAREGDASGDR